jgi:hypothetical protein
MLPPCTFHGDGHDESPALFSGRWEIRPRDPTSRAARAYSNLSCPIAFSKYDCAFQRRSDAIEFAERRFVPEHCAMPHQSIWEQLDAALPDNQTIHFYGDSVMRETFMSLACMSRELWEPAMPTIEWAAKPRGKPIPGGGHQLTPCHGVPECIEAGRFSTWRDKWRLRIGLTRGRYLNYGVNNAWNVWKKTFPHLPAGDIIVSSLPNVADQVHTHGKNLSERLWGMEDGMRRTQHDVLRFIHGGLTVVHREASPSHFRCPLDSENRDHCDGSFDEADVHAYNGCAPALMEVPTAIHLERRYLLPLARQGKMSYIPTIDMLLERGDWHVGGGSCKGATCGFRDCTHWCLPGPPDEWSRMIMAALTSRNTRDE